MAYMGDNSPCLVLLTERRLFVVYTTSGTGEQP